MQIKAVELMRKIRNELDKKYADVSLEERVRLMNEDLKTNSVWQHFHKSK